MNKVHRTIWSVNKGSWVVASEHAAARGKCSGGSLSKLAAAMLLAGTAGLTVFPSAVQAASIWNVSSGEWTTAGNWTGGLPTASTQAIISNGGTATLGVSSAKTGASSQVIVGNTAATTGTLVLQNASTLTTSSSGAILGNVANSTGTVTVTGGSTWADSGALNVGNAGTGTLTILNSSTVTSGGDITIAAQTGSTGTVTVDGTGSSLTSTGSMFAGQSGVGRLVVSNGATLTDNGTLEVGRFSGSNGSSVLATNGAQLKIGAIWVGNVGSGSFTAESGSQVTTGQMVVGAGVAGGIATITGTDTTVNVTNGTLFVGLNSGVGALTIADGADVSAARVSIGFTEKKFRKLGYTPNGTVIVTGAGSTLNASDWLIVGYSGKGSLLITDSGTTSVTVDSWIGYDAGSTGTVTVSGGTFNMNSSDTYVGDDGSGSLAVTSAGSMNGASLIVGNSSTGTGVVIVDGSGSTITATSGLWVGNAGTGTLTVEDSGTLTSGNAVLGNTSTGVGTVLLTGSGSSWTSSGSIVVGEAGTGTLTVADSATLTSVGGIIGDGSTGVGTVLLDGGTWTNSSSLVIAASGAGTLTIENGGSATATDVVIGQNAGATGEVLVTSGSSLLGSGALIVGNAGTGTLTVEDGGTLTSGDAVLGNASTGVGTALITGSGSSWASSGTITAGESGSGTLTIAEGATVTSGGGIIANSSGSTGTVLVTGTGSSWTDSGTLLVGNAGTGTLTIDDGGLVVAAGGTVVDAPTGTGTVNLNATSGNQGVLETRALTRGTGTAQVNFDGGILRAMADNPSFISGFNSGELNIASGGAYIDDAGYMIGSDSPFTGVGALTKQGSGTLIMTGDSTYTGGTTIEAGTLQLGNGGTTGSIIGDVTDNGTLTFNRSDVYAFDGVISGSGHVIQLGTGTTLLTAVSPYSGTTTVTAGTLAVGDAVNPGAALTGGGATRVASGATLGGYGRVNGTVTNNGTVAVANAISAFGSEANGTFTIGGTLINNGLAQVGGTGIGNTLMVNNYVGNSGTLALNTYLGTDGSPSDLLAINGGTATGTSSLLITNVGGAGALTLGNGILVVDALNGATTSSSAFTLGSRVIAGPYEYTLHRGARDGSSTEDWYLRSTAWLSNGADYRQEVSLYSALPSMTQVYGRELLGTLHQRVGEQEQLSCGCAFNPSGDDTVNGVWGRVINVRGKQGDGDLYGTGAQFDYKLSALQLGVDLYRHQEDDGRRDHVGIYGSIGRLNGNVEHYTGERAGTNSFDAYSLGAYATHYGASGWYVDSVLQGTWYENVKAQSSRNLMASSPVDVGLESKGFGVAASIEVGYPLELTDNWILEPQAQVVYQRVALNSASDVAANVRFAPATSMAERIGARLSTTRELDRGVESRLITPWVEANLWHESRGDNKTEISSEDGFVPFHSKLGGNWTEVGAGVTGQITRNTSLFAHASYEFGLDGERQANSYAVGVRVNW
jgi:fibronectin-binding autotransporter adhesin